MEKTGTTWKEIIALGGIGVLAWFVILKPSGAKAEEQQQGKADYLALTKKMQYAFSETFYGKILSQEGYKDVQGYFAKINLSMTMINNYVQTIYESKGTFDDDEDSLYSVFRIMKSITVCSIVAKTFNLRYNVNLYSYLSGFLNVDEFNRLYAIIDKKNYL